MCVFPACVCVFLCVCVWGGGDVVVTSSRPHSLYELFGGLCMTFCVNVNAYLVLCVCAWAQGSTKERCLEFSGILPPKTEGQMEKPRHKNQPEVPKGVRFLFGGHSQIDKNPGVWVRWVRESSLCEYWFRKLWNTQPGTVSSEWWEWIWLNVASPETNTVQTSKKCCVSCVSFCLYVCVCRCH